MEALVAYSSSESEDEHAEVKRLPINNKTADGRERLPLPNEIKSMKNKSIHDSPENDPSKHEGRIRSFQHERGNWATYVYIPVEMAILSDMQNAMIQSVAPELELKPSIDVHISLTRTVVLQHHWIDSFVSSIRSDVCFIKPFSLQLNSLNIYCNEERSRTFIGLCVDDNMTMPLKKLVEYLDIILSEYRLPVFYKNPSFHSSILWCVGDCESLLKEKLATLNTVLQSYMLKFNEEFQMSVNTISCKTGNKLYRFALS